MEVKNLTPTLQTSHNIVPSLEPAALTLDRFLENIHQTKERKNLQNKLLGNAYILVFHHHIHIDVVVTNATLSEFRMTRMTVAFNIHQQ